jgi:hypothetical protein
MAMFCPDCMQNLDDVPVGDPCPHCGGRRSNALAFASAALAAASAMAVTVTIGYNQEPGWSYQWDIAQRHLARLREQYQGINLRGNIDAEETVHALLLALNHLADWLYQDQATGLTKATVDAHVRTHPASLGVCRDYANTLKHMRRGSPAQPVARIAEIESGPSGQKVTIAHGPGNQPPASHARTDARDLAEQCEQSWRNLLTQHNIAIPP